MEVNKAPVLEFKVLLVIPSKVARVVSMTVAELESLASALDSARKAQLTEIDSERSGLLEFVFLFSLKQY